MRFTKVLPGETAQNTMASSARHTSLMEKPPVNTRDASVLVLLTPANEKENLLEWEVLLIRRNEYPGVHSGQISFPGGRYEKEDTDLWNTACREAYEEVGIQENHLEKVGQLTELYVPSSNFLIHPFVSICTAVDEIRTNPREVVNYKRVPLKVFDPDKATLKDFVYPDGKKWLAPTWPYEDYVIWGATAMILAELYTSIRDGILILEKG